MTGYGLSCEFTLSAMTRHWECCSIADIEPTALLHSGHPRQILHPLPKFDRFAAIPATRRSLIYFGTRPKGDSNFSLPND